MRTTSRILGLTWISQAILSFLFVQTVLFMSDNAGDSQPLQEFFQIRAVQTMYLSALVLDLVLAAVMFRNRAWTRTLGVTLAIADAVVTLALIPLSYAWMPETVRDKWQPLTSGCNAGIAGFVILLGLVALQIFLAERVANESPEQAKVF